MITPGLEQLEEKELESRLLQIVKNRSQPKKYEIDLAGIYRETRDIGNVEVAKTVEEIYQKHFRHKTDTDKWHQLSTSKRPNPSARQPQNIPRLHRHFIKEVLAGRYIVNPKIPVMGRIHLWFIRLRQQWKGRW